MKVNLAVDLDIHKFSGAGVTEYEAGMTNCVLHRKGDTVKVTQRPSIDISEDSTTISTLNNRGRGIYYWETNSKLYIVHDNDVYAATQNSTPIGNISAGYERVNMLETLGTPRMVILDAENNEGWVVSTGETVTKITSANFPATLTHGGAILDTYLFVMDEAGVIYNSDANDPTTFSASSLISTERDNDNGVYLAKHHDNLLAFGTRTIEAFYDAGNSVGSPLNRRQDVSYNIGCVSGLSVWEDGDDIYFLGSNPSGQVSCYRMRGFRPERISNDSMDSYFTQGVTQESLKFNLSGFSMMGRSVLVITVYILTGSPSAITPQVTFMYDAGMGQWGFINTPINSMTTLPIMAWTKRTGGQNETVSARTGEGILSNGDIINVNDKLIPQDTLLGSDGILVSGIVEAGILVSGASDSGINIPIVIRTGLQDFDTQAYKFQSYERIDCESTSASSLVTIKHANENSESFNTGKTVDISKPRKEIYQGGRFIRRNWQLEMAVSEQVFLEGLDIGVEAGL